MPENQSQAPMKLIERLYAMASEMKVKRVEGEPLLINRSEVEEFARYILGGFQFQKPSRSDLISLEAEILKGRCQYLGYYVKVV